MVQRVPPATTPSTSAPSYFVHFKLPNLTNCPNIDGDKCLVQPTTPRVKVWTATWETKLQDLLQYWLPTDLLVPGVELSQRDKRQQKAYGARHDNIKYNLQHREIDTNRPQVRVVASASTRTSRSQPNPRKASCTITGRSKTQVKSTTPTSIPTPPPKKNSH